MLPLRAFSAFSKKQRTPNTKKGKKIIFYITIHTISQNQISPYITNSIVLPSE